MHEYDNFDVTHEDGVAWLAIESETAMNSLNDGMTEELLQLATDLGEDDDVRCIVLRGSDGVFCAGGNITSFDEGNAAAGMRRGASFFHDLVVQLKAVETPVVTGIDGPGVGAGFSIALLGDVSVMHEDAYLQYGYPGIGLTGDGSSTYYLPRIVGLQEAKRIALLNEKVPAEEADDLGLVTEVASADAFEDRLAEVATQLADGPTKALGRIARMLEDSYARQLPDQLAEETDQMARTTRTGDYSEGVRAFKEKRDPEFQGR
ncbi:MAG: enoyl-CoA hydratase/isomerase family protein [Haloarculaceae archaeon]